MPTILAISIQGSFHIWLSKTKGTVTICARVLALPNTLGRNSFMAPMM